MVTGHGDWLSGGRGWWRLWPEVGRCSLDGGVRVGQMIVEAGL